MEFDSFIEIFNPAHKHLREERDRKRIEAQIPESAGPPLGIDLDGGVAHITLPSKGPATASPSAPSTPGQDEGD